ncbi:MAG: hypothetical protein FJ209_08290 [Betaproteobacteria bacterium]|nr:hypothetical protein [Betaproteobacteria bacterium]
MAAKKKSDGPKLPPGPVKGPAALNILTKPGESNEAAIARHVMNPAFSNVLSMKAYAAREWGADNLYLAELAEALEAQVKATKAGNLSHAEGLLVAQAHSLNAIYNGLAQRAMLNFNEYPDAGEKYLRLALKAQSQCRATLETLANIKNPPVVYARQANVTTGPQQVNNGVPACARENGIEQSELSEVGHELLPDARASGSECGTVPTASAVGEIHGAKVGRGKG